MHLDHGDDFKEIQDALDLGFSGVMIDGSALPYEENAAKTKESKAEATMEQKIIGKSKNKSRHERIAVLGYLRLLIIDNFKQDVELLSVMRSEIFGFTVDESQLNTLLSFFRSSGEEKDKSLSSKLQDLQETVGKVTETASKAARFLRTVRRSFQEIVNWFSHVKDLFH